MRDLDDFLNSFVNTPEKRAKLLRYFWVISLFMLVLGFFFMILFWDRGI
ncbi:MAG: hypothetical protein A4E32_00658 [Methanomassiliicoccales archaeon PtaU1.Bin124]|nr:MAG: hypothetical protein A4E32_00658 [Methanomassiliicoccales archaeon PtaU1.Bin124]